MKLEELCQPEARFTRESLDSFYDFCNSVYFTAVGEKTVERGRNMKIIKMLTNNNIIFTRVHKPLLLYLAESFKV
jgi:hypothetical protein